MAADEWAAAITNNIKALPKQASEFFQVV